jgi:hypothetical protein
MHVKCSIQQQGQQWGWQQQQQQERCAAGAHKELP